MKKSNMLKPVLFFLLITLLTVDSVAQSKQVTPVYPDSTWLQYANPEQAGWSSEKIARAKEISDSLGSDAVMLIHNGAIVTEWGHNTAVEFIASMYKSIFNGLYGIAVEEGEIDTSTTLADLGIKAKPSLNETERTAKVIDLLSASSGIFRPIRGEWESGPKPGEQWFYNGWDFHTLGSIYEQETGEIVFKAIEEKIAEPIGMEDYEARWGHYFSQPWRTEHPSYNIWMSARDLARYGLLYLRKGQWKSDQVIPSSWVETSTEPRFKYVIGREIPVHYGLLWWIKGNELAQYDTYLASGTGSQSIIVLPKLDMVFVHRASRDYNQGVYGLDAEKILLQLIDARPENAVSDPELIPVEWSQDTE